MAALAPSAVARSIVQRVAWRARGWTHLTQLQRRGLTVGAKTYIGSGAHLDPDFCFLITIGSGVTLSINVTVLAHDAAGRHVVGYSRIAPVVIEDHVFVGAGTMILPGVTVGTGAIIGAGSVVTRDVGPGEVVAGAPARPVGDRAGFIAHHEARMADRPKWTRRGWTANTGIDPAKMESMRAALAEHGDGYIT